MARHPWDVLLIYICMMAVTLEPERVRGDDPIQTCLFLESCVLPCSFRAGSEEVIHWLLGDTPVHSYYQGEDQLALQDGRFRGRTSLVLDRIPRGDASLRLANVSLQDQGTYKCYASTNRGNQETLIKVIVEAPVRSVDLRLSGEELVCSSGGIYPDPELLWSSPHPARNHTRREEDTQGLFSITGSLLLPGDAAEEDYVCSVSSRSQTRTASWRRQAPVHVSMGVGVTLPCGVSESDSQDFNVTWTFNQELILTYTSSSPSPGDSQIQDLWRELVQNVSVSGSLELRGLTAAHQGAYTCRLSRAGNTHLLITDLELLSRERHGVIAAGALFAITIVISTIYHLCEKK